MKKKIGFAVVTIMMMVLLGGCKGQEVKVTFDAYHDYSGAVLQISYEGGNDTLASTSYTTKKGKRVKKVLEQYKVETLEAICEYDEFEGWMQYEVIRHTNETGEEKLEYVSCSENTVYSWEEVQEIKVENEDTLFVAKWKSIPMGAYFTDMSMTGNEMETAYSMTLYANGGTLHFNEINAFETDVYTCWMEKGKSVQESMESQSGDLLTGTTKEAATFGGWDIYVGDSAEWTDVQVEKAQSKCFSLGDNVFLVLEGASLYQEGVTTEALKDMICEGKHFYAVAKWK